MSSLTQILRGSENIFYQAIHQFQGRWLASAGALLETGLAYGQTLSPHIASHINTTRLLSNIVNSCSLIWDGIELSRAIRGKDNTLFSILQSSSSLSSMQKSHAAAALLLTAAALTAIHSTYQWATAPKQAPEEWRNNITAEERPSVSLKFEHPLSQSFGQALYLIRIVTNIAIACLSPERALLCSINAAGLAYSLLKTSQVRWLNLTRLMQIPQPRGLFFPDANKVHCKELSYSYIFPLLPHSMKGRKCILCQGDTPSTSFSPSSPFDPECLVSYVYDNSKKIGTHTNPNYTRHMERGRADYYSAILEIPESDLPLCPINKNRPFSHYVTAQFTDWYKGRFRTTVKVLTDPFVTPNLPLISEKLWARLGTIYSTFQAGLASMQQRHPELAGKILLTQKVLGLLDLGLLAQNYYQLYQTLYARYIPKKINQNLSRQQLDQAQSRYDAARLAEAQLGQRINTALENGTIEKVNVIRSKTARGSTLIDQWNAATEFEKEQLKSQINDALDNEDVVMSEELEGKTPETEALLDEYDTAMDELGEAIEQKAAAETQRAKNRLSLEKKYRVRLYIGMGVGIAGISVISAIAVSILNKKLIPAFNLTDILKKVATKEDFSNMKISWSMPWISYATECILASRLAANFALAYFSPHRKTYLTNALVQAFTLTKLAQLPWIKLERTFRTDVPNTMKELHATFECLLPRPSATTLEADIKTAYDITTSFFKGASWSRYFLIRKQNGVEVSRQLTYDATVNPIKLTTLFFDRITAWAQDITYGKSPVNIKYTVAV